MKKENTQWAESITNFQNSANCAGVKGEKRQTTLAIHILSIKTKQMSFRKYKLLYLKHFKILNILV